MQTWFSPSHHTLTFICPPVCLPVYLSIYLSACLPVCLLTLAGHPAAASLVWFIALGMRGKVAAAAATSCEKKVEQLLLSSSETICCIVGLPGASADADKFSCAWSIVLLPFECAQSIWRRTCQINIRQESDWNFVVNIIEKKVFVFTSNTI